MTTWGRGAPAVLALAAVMMLAGCSGHLISESERVRWIDSIGQDRKDLSPDCLGVGVDCADLADQIDSTMADLQRTAAKWGDDDDHYAEVRRDTATARKAYRAYAGDQCRNAGVNSPQANSCNPDFNSLLSAEAKVQEDLTGAKSDAA